MSGHSKWANIKHKKEKTDAQKAKVFTKIGREISFFCVYLFPYIFALTLIGSPNRLIKPAASA